MKRFVLILISVTAFVSGAAGFGTSEEAPAAPLARPNQSGEFSGSASCRQCHERFYKLWAPEDPQTRNRARRAGAVAFFRKPVDSPALIDAIQWVVSKCNQ